MQCTGPHVAAPLSLHFFSTVSHRDFLSCSPAHIDNTTTVAIMPTPVEQPQTAADKIKAQREEARRLRLAGEELTALRAYRDSLPAPPPGVTQAQLEEFIEGKRRAIANIDFAINEVVPAIEQSIKDMTKELESAQDNLPELLRAKGGCDATQRIRKICLAFLDRTALEKADDESGTVVVPERAAKIAELERNLADCKERLQQSEKEVASLRQQLDRA